MGRTIIIGDIHGCYTEFCDLLEETNFQAGQDHLYLTGDIINRGPESKKVFLLVRELKAEVVLGNHEFHLLRANRLNLKGIPRIKKLKAEFGILYPQLLSYLSSWPCYIVTKDFILVHGGLSPLSDPAATAPELLVSIRTWDGTGRDIQLRSNPPWFDFYRGDKLVVFGHWAELGGVVRKNVIGVDTGCVYGKKLSALILPERKIISVPAQKIYCPI